MAKTILKNTTAHDIALCLANGNDIKRISIPTTFKNRETGVTTGGFAEIDADFLANAKARSEVVRFWLSSEH